MFLNGFNQVGMTLGTHSFTNHAQPQNQYSSVHAGNVHQTAQGTQGLIQNLNELEAWIAGEAKSSHQCRWPIDTFPLSIHIDHHHKPVYISEKEFSMLLYKALGQWQQACPLIQWHMVSETGASNTDSDIMLRWVDETTHGREFEVGHAKRQVSSQKNLTGYFNIQQVTIELISNPAIDRKLSPQERMNRLNATLLHEAGHALGLEHGLTPNDVMYHQGWKNTQLSINDIQAIQALYKV